MVIEMLLAVSLLGIGILIGIGLSLGMIVFATKKPNFLEEVGRTSVLGSYPQGYIVGSDSDTERYPDGQEVKIK